MKLLCLDCDSTLSKIEGVDELAAVRGEEVKQQIIDLTNQAMSGEVPIEEVFAKRLELIRPSLDNCNAVGDLYIQHAATGVKTVINDLSNMGWTPIIISGGFVQPIEPFAKYLSINEIYAVPLHFNVEGEYESFDPTPTTRNGGKPEIIQFLLKKYNPEKIVMVGDGVSDLETQGLVDLFIGYGEFEVRTKVKQYAESYVYSFEELSKLIND